VQDIVGDDIKRDDDEEEVYDGEDIMSPNKPSTMTKRKNMSLSSE